MKKNIFQTLLSGVPNGHPHFLQMMILHQHLMASSAMAANINRLRAQQQFPVVGKIPPCHEVSISSTFYALTFCTKVLGVMFWRKKHFRMKNAIVKCRWNWLEVSISPTFYKQFFFAQRCFLQLFSVCSLTCGERLSVQKLLIKCWWYWLEDSYVL